MVNVNPADEWPWTVVQVWASTGLSLGELFHLESADLAEIVDELSWHVAL